MNSALAQVKLASGDGGYALREGTESQIADAVIVPSTTFVGGAVDQFARASDKIMYLNSKNRIPISLREG